MERSGSKRILGVALLVSALVMVALAGLIFSGFFRIEDSGRPLVAGALLLASAVDAAVGLKFFVAP